MKNRQTILAKLKKKGVKATPQRLAIIAYLENTYTHPSAEEVHRSVRKKYPSVSLGTVYNTLDKLEEINELIKLQIAKDRIRFEYHTEPHQHFFCKTCQRIYDVKIKCPYLDTLKVGPHKLEEVHGYFKGICAACLKKQKRGKHQ